MKTNAYLLLILVLLAGCKATDPLADSVLDASDFEYDEADYSDTSIVVYEYTDSVETEERLLDEIEVVAPRGHVLQPYRASATRLFDLLHTSLDLRFDWTQEHVHGRAELLLLPFFKPQNELVLDAKNFDIIQVSNETDRELDYSYDGQKLKIALGKTYTAQDTLLVFIDYVAKPSEGESDGSAAITSDRGLFFINAQNQLANKPQQIWTQGETEHNSRWFPTIDKPNERCTQEIKLTVDNRFVTLSNGNLVSSKSNADSTRTDHWVQDKPHAPYLFMIAVGEYEVVKEKWKDLELAYYVDPGYGPYAKDIFAHTPEMISFFSDKLNYPFPWDKYSQIIAEDYVSGAMENTTAVIFGDFIQKTDRELIDNDNDYIVAHELIHHWFGDLVTCESWSNLTLNEGFATYSEFLWKEHKEGRYAADAYRHNQKMEYLSSLAYEAPHDLINFHYEDKEDMFDAHSYNKGALVLHMLRDYMGDDAFYASLHHYLTDHAYTAVEADELRMSFEDTYGEDLNWFFDQWFFAAGHPKLLLEYDYDQDAQEVVIRIKQDQNPEVAPAIYQLPVSIDVYNDEGVASTFDIWLNKREQEIRLSYDENPALVIFDSDDVLLFIKEEKKTQEAYAKQYLWTDAFAHRLEAIEKLIPEQSTIGDEALLAALRDESEVIRMKTIEKLPLKTDESLVATLEDMALHDVHSGVRAKAIDKLTAVQSYDWLSLAKKVMETEKAYPVISQVLLGLNEKDPQSALASAQKLTTENTNMLAPALGTVFASSGDAAYIPFFEDRLDKVSMYQIFTFYEQYFELLKQQDPSVIQAKSTRLYQLSTDTKQHMFTRFVSTQTLYKLQQQLSQSAPDIAQQLGNMVEEIKNQETNEMLLKRYQMF